MGYLSKLNLQKESPGDVRLPIFVVWPEFLSATKCCDFFQHGTKDQWGHLHIERTGGIRIITTRGKPDAFFHRRFHGRISDNSSSLKIILTQTIHVWYIYLHENHKNQPHVGKYTSPMDGMYGLGLKSSMFVFPSKGSNQEPTLRNPIPSTPKTNINQPLLEAKKGSKVTPSGCFRK